jgi:cytochrome c553
MISIKTVFLRCRLLLATGFATLALLTSVQTAHAASGYLTTWNSLYGTQQNSGNGAGCQVCHAASTQNLNPYGAAFCNASGSTTQRIQAAENPDSDNDPTGTNNIGEINANAQPGWQLFT